MSNMGRLDLLRVARELTTTAVITHNAAIGGIADRVVQMADGRIVDTRVNRNKVTPGELSW